MNYTLKRKAFEALRGSTLERTVKRLGAASIPIDNGPNDQVSDLSGNLVCYKKILFKQIFILLKSFKFNFFKFLKQLID